MIPEADKLAAEAFVEESRDANAPLLRHAKPEGARPAPVASVSNPQHAPSEIAGQPKNGALQNSNGVTATAPLLKAPAGDGALPTTIMPSPAPFRDRLQNIEQAMWSRAESIKRELQVLVQEQQILGPANDETLLSSITRLRTIAASLNQWLIEAERNLRFKIQ
jgi:hypothetical protein